LKQQANYNRIDNDFLKDVIEGLGKNPKTLKPKYFYDNRGAQLFTEICTTPEYYPTRTEIKILNQNAEDIASQIGDNTALIEYGSGALEKIKILLNFLKEPVGLIPVDISEDQLFVSAKNLENLYPNLEILPVAADFTKPIPIPGFSQPPKKYLAFFPGSTIGNFEPDLAIQFLQGVTKTIGLDGLLLIGFDLKKDIETLLAAYDDQRGVTASFNKNLLSRVNGELGGNFNLNTFEHVARYNENKGRIEMHLKSTMEQTVSINKELFEFLEGETIHTENCYKFTKESFTAMSSKAGLSPVKTWTDDKNLFAVMLLRTTSNL
jgi:dimethylhistidine N-methyltransferase